MTVDFSEYFWGEGQKTSGIEVLFQNAKSGVASTREVAEFLKERSSVEESHSKSLIKLAKVAANGCPNGSFAPMWQVLKNLSDKLSSAHSQMVQKIEELVKELLKYADELQKQYKSVKENETGTLESVQLYQNSKTMVSKTKAVYVQRYLELEKCQKDSVPQKELEKADARMKKAHEEYKSWVEKYQSCTEEYVSKMTESCRRFQDVEIFYLEKMKEFMDTYANVMDNNQEAIGVVHNEFRNDCATLTVEELLQQLVRQKATGNTRPSINVDADDSLVNLEISQSGSSEDKSLSIGEREKEKPTSLATATSTAPGTTIAPTVVASEKIFEGNDTSVSPSASNSMTMSLGDRSSNKGSRRTTSLLNLFIPQSQGSKSSNPAKGVESLNPLASTEAVDIEKNPSTLSRSNNRGSKWFLRSRRGKKKDKKKEKVEDASSSLEGTENVSQNQSESSIENTSAAAIVNVSPPGVDAEGFTIRPSDVWEETPGKFYSSSDTDSDDEPEKRLHVEIKPLTNGTAPLSASVDELRTTIENLTLASAGVSSRKLIIDADAQMKRSQSVSQQIGSTSPPPRHPYAPLSPPKAPHSETSPNPPVNTSDYTARYAELGDLFAEVGELQPSLPPKTSISRTTPTLGGGTMSIPRPPSRPRPEIPLMPQRNTGSPSPVVSRADSVTSLETKSIGSHRSGSRGPSPLTLGMSDSIPIAIAFHEIIHAYFKGNDENQCKVKMTGDMMVSFPAGIIQVFTNNPSPSQLSFQVRSKQRLENLISNKNFVKVETVGDVLHFEFDMSALTILLKSHSEKNPTASYFNVDILKYHIKPKPGAASCPLHLVAFWKCETHQTDLRIDYKYNGHSMEPNQSEIDSSKSSPSKSPNPPSPPLSQVCVAAPVDGGVKTMQSKPSGQWFSNTNRACWKLSTLSTKSDNLGVGSLRARFEVSSGPSSNGTIAAQFSCENSTLSGCEFELIGSGYRVSLVKKRFVSGKYICDSEENSNRYAVPPEYSKPIHL